MFQRQRAAGLLVVPFLLLAGAAIGSGPTYSVTLAGELPANSWIAVRFNVTPDNDLSIPGQLRMFPGEEVRMGGAAFGIVDGEAALKSLYPGSTHWLVNKSPGHVQTPVARVEPEPEFLGSIFSGQPGGGGLGFGASSPFPHPEHSYTLVAIYRAAHADYRLDATWTRGVESWDVQTGPAIALAADELGGGVHAGTYTFAGAAGVGGLLQREMGTTTDTIGWFLPHSDATLGHTQSRCTQDGEACEPFGGWQGAQKVISKGGTDWQFAVDAIVEADIPTVALGIAELPDNTYLAE